MAQPPPRPQMGKWSPLPQYPRQKHPQSAATDDHLLSVRRGVAWELGLLGPRGGGEWGRPGSWAASVTRWPAEPKEPGLRLG